MSTFVSLASNSFLSLFFPVLDSGPPGLMAFIIWSDLQLIWSFPSIFDALFLIDIHSQWRNGSEESYTAPQPKNPSQAPETKKTI